MYNKVILAAKTCYCVYVESIYVSVRMNHAAKTCYCVYVESIYVTVRMNYRALNAIVKT